jgi:hypothetical protein
MKNNTSWLHAGVLRVSRWHFLYVLILVVQIWVYDAWHLIPPEAVMQRWIITALLLAVTAVVWYFAHNSRRSNTAYRWMIYTLILTDIAVASLSVYTQRGMASRAVMLYAIPLVVSGLLLSRAAVFATAAICAASYTTAAVMYFVLHFNEGYKIELYGETGFYSAILFLLAIMLWAVYKSKHKN